MVGSVVGPMVTEQAAVDERAEARSGRRSPPTDRVVQVLDFLAAHPDRRFGLSELARSLKISKPTCLGIVSALVASGYLTRDPQSKTYGLGPALIAAGRAAQRSFAVGPVARSYLEKLSAEFDTTCVASAVIGDRIAVLEAVGPRDARSPVRVGSVYPFAPPVGLMYVIWDRDAALESWLRREPALPVRLDRERLRAVVDECRATGYLVESLDPVGQRLHRLMAGVDVHELPAEVRELIGEMASSLGERVYLGRDIGCGSGAGIGGDTGEGAIHPVNLIAAPAYDADGRQALVLTLYVGASITGAEIGERGAALTAAAEAVTAEMGGRRPRW